MKKLGLILVSFLLLISLAGCSISIDLNELSKASSDPFPSDTIEKYEDAVNNMDVQGMMDCMGEDMQNAMTSMLDIGLGIISSLTGVKISDYISASDLLNIMPMLTGLSMEFIGEDGLAVAQVNFDVYATYIKGDTATVLFTETNSGENMALNMVKEDGKWVFAMTTTAITAENADRVITKDGDSADESDPE